MSIHTNHKRQKKYWTLDPNAMQKDVPIEYHGTYHYVISSHSRYTMISQPNTGVDMNVPVR